MVFVADALGAWLVGLLADAGRRRLTDWVLGSGQERALRQAATVAVRLTAAELHPEGGELAEQLAMVIGQVFSEPVPGVMLAERAMLLDVLEAGIADQLAVLDDPGMTGTERSAADLLGVSATVLSQKLTSHLVQQIMVRGAHGDPLEPLAAQLNHDVTHLQGKRLQGMFGQLADEAREAFARLDDRDHHERTPRLDARVTTHRAVMPKPISGLPLYLLELRLLGPNDLDEVDVYIEDGRWLAFTAHQKDVNPPFSVGFAMGDFSPEATLISRHATHARPLHIGGKPASWRVQLANIPLTTGDQAPCLRVECRTANESWCVAVPVRDAEILLDHPVIRLGLGPSWPGPRPIRWPPNVPPG